MAHDVLSRRGQEAAPDLLRGQAAELACVPSGRAQLLSLALEQAAESIAKGAGSPEVDLSPLLEPKELPKARRARIHAAAEARSALPPEASEPGPSPALELAALLNERLWSDPRIPATEEARVAMLAAAPKLRAKAHQSERRPWWRRLLDAARR